MCDVKATDFSYLSLVEVTHRDECVLRPLIKLRIVVTANVHTHEYGKDLGVVACFVDPKYPGVIQSEFLVVFMQRNPFVQGPDHGFLVASQEMVHQWPVTLMIGGGVEEGPHEFINDVMYETCVDVTVDSSVGESVPGRLASTDVSIVEYVVSYTVRALQLKEQQHNQHHFRLWL